MTTMTMPEVLWELAEEVRAIAIDRGWEEGIEERTFGDFIALAHSELSEALEEYRNGHAPDELYHTRLGPDPTDVEAKPRGIPIEIADVFIRLLHVCAYYDIDIGEAIRQKMEFNRTRPHRHGGKRL